MNLLCRAKSFAFSQFCDWFCRPGALITLDCTLYTRVQYPPIHRLVDAGEVKRSREKKTKFSPFWYENGKFFFSLSRCYPLASIIVSPVPKPFNRSFPWTSIFLAVIYVCFTSFSAIIFNGFYEFFPIQSVARSTSNNYFLCSRASRWKFWV